MTSLVLLTNFQYAGIQFWFAQPITRILGSADTMIISTFAVLFPSGIAVMLIRRQIVKIIHETLII